MWRPGVKLLPDPWPPEFLPGNLGIAVFLCAFPMEAYSSGVRVSLSRLIAASTSPVARLYRSLRSGAQTSDSSIGNHTSPSSSASAALNSTTKLTTMVKPSTPRALPSAMETVPPSTQDTGGHGREEGDRMVATDTTRRCIHQVPAVDGVVLSEAHL